MKNIIFPITTIICLLLSITSAQAQRISLTANVGKFNMDKIESPNADIDYQGSSSVSANLRLYTNSKWALRLGAGLDNIQYEVGDGLQTDYKAKRKDLKGIIGVEKHFPMLGKSLDIYPGVFVPITITGEDVMQNNYDNFTNGDARAGLGLVLGANIKLIKILRLGVEFDATYDNVKNQIWESADQVSTVPLKDITTNVAFTIGVAL